MRPQTHAPTIFRRTSAHQSAAMDALLAGPAPPIVHDTIRQQLEELVESRSPSVTFDTGGLDRAVQQVLQGTPMDRYGVWVHYSWLNRLVHVLDEAEFIELRCDRNRNKITAEEQKRLQNVRVGVVGLSVGRVVAVTLAQERACGALKLADFDTLSLSNINRLRSGIHCIGDNKAVLAAREIAEIDPFFPVEVLPDGLTDARLEEFLSGGGKLDVLIDECDDLRLKFLLRYRARSLRIPVLMDTSDRGLLDVERFDKEPERPIFHGLVDDIDPETLRDLSTEEKVPTVMRILEGENLSPRAIASLVEVGETLSSWPQLASGVMLGGAITTDAVRRIALGTFTESGRFRVDLEDLICDRPTGAGSEEQIAQTAEPSAVQAPALRPLVANDACLARILEAAVTAPSGGNNQPWLWKPTSEGVLLHHDVERSASFLDFEQGAAMMALGAAAENFVLAAHREQLTVQVIPFPRGGDPDVVALLKMPSDVDESGEHDHLAMHIAERCTNRKLGPRHGLSDDQRTALERSVEATPGAKLALLASQEELDIIGSVLGRGDRLRFLSEQLHREMMSEVRWTREEAERTRDGIDVRTLELTPADLAGIRLCRSWTAMRIVRDVGGGSVLEKGSKKAVANSSAVGLVTMPKATRRDYFEGGRAVQRLWLTAHSLGLAVQPMSSLPYIFARLVRGKGVGMPKAQIQAFTQLREEYLKLFHVSDDQAEVLVVRLAFAAPVEVRALRRPVSAVLMG